MSSYSIAPAWSCHEKPANFSFEEAANYLGNYETAYHVVCHCAQAKPGETILIHGSTGGTGLAAVQIAKILGLNIIATGGSDDKLEIVKANGADHVLNIRDDNVENKLGITKFRDQVRALTNGKYEKHKQSFKLKRNPKTTYLAYQLLICYMHSRFLDLSNCEVLDCSVLQTKK